MSTFSWFCIIFAVMNDLLGYFWAKDKNNLNHCLSCGLSSIMWALLALVCREVK
jgi:hypothetical protein